MLTESTSRLATASRSAIRTYKGIGVSPGIAIGRAVIIERREAAIYRVPIRDDEVPSEVNRFLEAVEKDILALGYRTVNVTKPRSAGPCPDIDALAERCDYVVNAVAD